MKNLTTYVLLILLTLISNIISANPNINIVIQLPVKYNQLTGELVTPDKVLMQNGLRNYQKGYYKSFFKDMKKASAFGNSIAQKYVGLSYINAWGVEKDWTRAHAWIKLAALDKTLKHKKLEEMIFKELLPKEVQKAEKNYLEITEDYGTLATTERRKRWQQKQKRSALGSRTGARTGRVKHAKIVDMGEFSILTDINGKTEVALDEMLSFVVDYNFGITDPNGGIVTSGKIIPVED